MHDNSVPAASIHHRLEMVQQALERGQPELAERLMQEMGLTLATTAPELCALLIAGVLGHIGFEATETERIERTRSFRGRSKQTGRAFESKPIKEFQHIVRTVRLI